MSKLHFFFGFRARICILFIVPEVNPPDLQTLLNKLSSLEAKLTLALSQLEVAKTELVLKNQLIEALRHKIFGSSSERLDPSQLQLLFGEEVLGKPAAPPETGGDESAPEEQGKRKGNASPRKKKSDRFPANLKVVIDGVIIPPEVAANPGDWTEIPGTHHDELDVIRPQMFWRRTVIKKFVNKHNRSLPPVSGAAPEASLPGTLCAPGLAAQIVVDKFCDHLPHDRQSKRMMRFFKADIGRQTLNRWTHRVADHLKPVGEAIKAELFRANRLQVDETTMDYLLPGRGSTKLGYLWTYLDPLRKTVYFDWQLGRGHECLLDIIGIDPQTGMTNFQGIIQCDGYSAYDALVSRYGGIRLAGCLAHIRRKFYEAAKQASERVLPILLEIQALYRIESQLRCSKAPPDCRKLVRLARARPIVENLHQLILNERTAHLPESNLGKAVNYALGQWDKFVLYLENGELEIDNNLVENAIRPTKLGLKNYLFFGSAEAGENNAMLYTLIENCKLQGIDPERYLAEVIERLPADATSEQAAELTPSKVAAKWLAAERSEDAEVAA